MRHLSRMKYLYIPENYPDSDPAYVRVPVNGDELQRRIAKKNLIHKFSKKLSVQEIRRQAPGVIAKFIALVDEPDEDLAAARKRLFELADFAVSERLLDELEAKLIPALTARAQFQQWAAGEAETPMQPGEVAPPITKPEAPRLPLCPVETVIELWKTERHEANEPPPKPKAVRAKQGAFRRFFEHFGLADDMADPQIDRSLLQEHKEYLRTRGETVAHYDLTHMDTMYSIAERNEKVRPNPFTGFHIPGKPKGQKRSSFADADACTIMDGVIDAEPIVRWGNWFGATLGLIIEEFSE